MAPMRLYPASASGRTRTLTGDLAVLAALIVFAWLGVKVHDAVAELASVGRSIQDSGRALAATTRATAGGAGGPFNGVAGKVQGLPLVGGDLANALRDAPRAATDPIRASGDAQGAK